MNLYCSIPDCGKPVENRDTGLCSTHNREARKAEERAKRVKIVTMEIKKVSPKMAKALQEYSKLKKEWLPGKKCVVYPELDAIEPHHSRGKATIKLLLDTQWWVPVSRPGHIFIEANVSWAIEKGFTKTRLGIFEEPHKI